VSFVIPPEINSWDRLTTAQFYHRDMGWAVHALCPPDRGDDNERGKKPVAKGWRSHTAAEVTPDYLAKYFANGSNHNLGVVVRSPFVHVDLDSKPDAGASVRAWLELQPHLATVPRERTGGGAHLVFICRDLPESVAKAKKAISIQITPVVTAELYTDGMNLVVSPSVHKSGNRYAWEIIGDIPETSWVQLKQWFGFAEPDAARRGRPPKEKPWWARFKGALHTLDAVALFRETDRLGDCIDPDEGKWTVRCPWSGEHSKGDDKVGTDTVIFQGEATDSPPGFKCLHAHCSERSLKDVLEFLDDNKPGIVDRHCREMRVWAEGQTSPDGRPRVLLPEMDRPDSEFAAEMSQHIGPCKVWFNKAETVVAVAMRRFSEKITALTFHPVQPIEACTAAEQFVQTGVLREDKSSGDMIFLRHTMSRECAAKLIASPQFRRKLPEIVRILDIPLPIRLHGGIVFPDPGYDPRFCSYLDPAAPQIRPMPLERAIELLQEVHADFGWKDDQSLVHALARIITPFCRGLMGWDARFPLWHYSGNRPRAGKDYLAGVTQLLYEGRTCEDAPLERESEETRKRITAALMAGRRTTHFANCQGYIQDAALIGAITSKTFAARNLGSTEAKADLTLPNEIEFSISANVGLTFREDVEPRTRKIGLVFFEENPNGRDFVKPDLHGWVLEHRAEILSAIGALVKRWIDCGCPSGPTPFNSFPEWGRTVGGIMHACGLGDPCLPHLDDGTVGGDLLEKAMRALYQIGFENYPDSWFEKGDLFRVVANSDDEDLSFFGGFGDESTARETKKRVGRFMAQFRGRELSGVILEIDGRAKGERQMVRFAGAAGRNRPASQILLSVFGNSGNNGIPTGCAEHGGKKFREKKEKKEELKRESNRTGSGYSIVSAVSMISDRAEFAEIAFAIESAGSVALDIETFGPRKSDALNPWRGEIRLLSLKIEGRDPWLIDLQSTGYDLGPLSTALASVTVIAHNFKFDALWLAVKCSVKIRKAFCTLTAARLLSAGTRPGNDLNKCLDRYLGIKPTADHSTSDWGGMFLTDDQLAYAARDVMHLHALNEVLARKLEQNGLDAVAELEMAILPVIVEMEAAGMAVDSVRLESIRDQAKSGVDEKTAALRDLVNDQQLNPSSPAQLQAALARAGIAVPNTNEETLKANDDCRIIPLILDLRGQEKLAQQAQSLLDCVEKDGRIHGRFDPTGTATGRFSSKEPNLQNISRGELRSCFIAQEGSNLVVADYSQIELRAAAAIAGETKMIEAFRRGEDLHKTTAAAILDKPVSEVTKEDRQISKSANFGLLYGQSAKGLVKYAASSYGVRLSEEDAQEIRAKFFRTYGSLRQWHGESHMKAEKGISEVRTVLGRRRLIPAEATAWESFTALVNTPVQGGCADGMKQAIVALAQRLPEGARIISTVHDELIIEAGLADADAVRQIVETAMVEAMSELFPQVPVEVEAKVCNAWDEK
jgi:DNA polymerase I-like protein with 3'-5' exonuclease and polymerase domains